MNETLSTPGADTPGESGRAEERGGSSPGDDVPRQTPELWSLTVVAAAEGFFKVLEIGPDPLDELKPTIHRDDLGVDWERYGSDEEYIEVPAKIVKLRHVFPYQHEPEPAAEGDEDILRPPEPSQMNLKGDRPRDHHDL